MQGMEKTIPEVYSMLKSAEVEIKKEQREYKEFEQLFTVPVHCNQTHGPGSS